MYVCMYVCKVILFLQKSECECKKLEKWARYFLPQPSTYPTPIVLFSYLILAAPKVLSLSHFLGCVRQKVQPSFSSPFSLILFSSLFALTRQPPLSHQNKTSLSKEEIKGLTLKFQLPSLRVSNQKLHLVISISLSTILILEAEL